jgi:hypothetical protein
MRNVYCRHRQLPPCDRCLVREMWINALIAVFVFVVLITAAGVFDR